MEYYVDNNNLFDSNGYEVTANLDGVINILVAGMPKRFIKAKFIKWLQDNPASQCAKPKMAKRTVAVDPVTGKRRWTGIFNVPREKWKPRKKQKPRKKELFPRERKGIELYAVLGKKKIGPFRSLQECSKTIGLSKSSISKTLNGRTNYAGWKFEKVA